MLKARFVIWMCWVHIFVLCCPTPGQTSLTEFTIRDELELARKFDVMIETYFPVVEDVEISGYVRDLVDRLAQTMPPQPFPLKVTVVRHGAMNAFASAAGHITVFTGLIANLHSEDELASVLAHELAHVSERHIAKAIEKSKIIGVGTMLGMLAGVLIGSQTQGETGEALALGSLAGSQALQLQYSRQNEAEADQYGVDFLVAAGFNPLGITAAFERIRKLQWIAGGGGVPSYLTTHPGMNERIGAMEERIARLPEEVRTRSTDNSRFLRAKAMSQAWHTDARSALAVFRAAKDMPACLARLGEAIAYSRQQQTENARQSFALAMQCNGADPLWQREYGRFAFEFGRLEDAFSALHTAVLKRPRDLLALFFYARAGVEKGDVATGIDALNRVLKEVPRDAEVLEYLGRFQAAQGDHLNAHLNFAKAMAYRRQFARYAYHVRQAEGLALTEVQREAISAVQQEIAEYRQILGLPSE